MPAYLFSNSPLPLLTLLIVTPLIGMALVGVGALLRLDDRLIKRGATAWALIPIGITALLYAGFDPYAIRGSQQVIQFVEKIAWAQAIRVDYFVGVDGLSLPLVMLTALVTPIAMAASFGVQQRVKTHFALLFLLEAAMLGFFVALNFFFFFIFWEFSLVPAFFLIQGWGRDERRRRQAAFTFFVYTLAGSLGMLLLFLLLYAATGAAGRATFDIVELGRLGQGLAVDGIPGTLQAILANFLGQAGMAPAYAAFAFWSVFVAFAIKLAVWPFHTWLPDTYAEAPTAASVLLAAVMSKMGGYGMLRVLLPFFPEAAAAAAPWVGVLAVIGVLVGAFGALSHTSGDLKRLVAYTSINHMGYVALAVAGLAALPAGDTQSRA
ncbi:MAG TPA: NADH-quinone oxidoreductase subunit M, partial [Roseiflexaceae bacterium]|nr:NADH-quinone oxidoreductase subunit M [Roseiflexaceae bacterium]